MSTTFSVFTKTLSSLARTNGDVTQDRMFFVTSLPTGEVSATNHETIDDLERVTSVTGLFSASSLFCSVLSLNTELLKRAF